MRFNDLGSAIVAGRQSQSIGIQMFMRKFDGAYRAHYYLVNQRIHQGKSKSVEVVLGGTNDAYWLFQPHDKKVCFQLRACIFLLIILLNYVQDIKTLNSFRVLTVVCNNCRIIG